MKKYLIEFAPAKYVIGQKSDMLARGNDEEYPTFELEDGELISVPRNRIKKVWDESEDD